MSKTEPRTYGWRPDTPDHRDRLYSAPKGALEALPQVVDLRGSCPPVVDQGALGSCTANAISSAFQFLQKKQQVRDFQPSRLFLYYNERLAEGTVNSDAGAMIRTGIKSAAKEGMCAETLWQYEISRFKNRPTEQCYAVAETNQSLVYQRVPRDIGQIKSVLASGLPFVYGFSVYESFNEAAATGIVKMPRVRERFLGGHAVMACGYDDSLDAVLTQNSYGRRWGKDGYFWIPLMYLLSPNLSDDFWVIQKVEGATVNPTPDPGPPKPPGNNLQFDGFQAYMPARAGDPISFAKN